MFRVPNPNENKKYTIYKLYKIQSNSSIGQGINNICKENYVPSS